jgi:hypothetical protein
MEQLREYVAGLAGPKLSENPLVRTHAFDFGAGLGCYLIKDLMEAGIGCGNAQSMAIPCNRGGRRTIVGGPAWSLAGV